MQAKKSPEVKVWFGKVVLSTEKGGESGGCDILNRRAALLK
jgi:hypothetical protein